jgi:hypothetical protein
MATIVELQAPLPGLTPLPRLVELSGTRSFVSGDPDGERLRVAWFRRDDDGALVGRAWCGPLAEGPPAHVHGGAMAALLDEAMGLCCWVHGHRVLARGIEVAFRRPLALGSVVWLVGRIVGHDGRRLTTSGTLSSEGDGGVVFAEATGSFSELPAERFARLFERGGSAGGSSER